MKKILCLLLVVIVISSSLFALDLGRGVSLQPVSFKSLYRQGRANPYSFLAHSHLTYMPEDEDSAFMIRALVKDSEGNLSYKDFQTNKLEEMTKRHMNINLKPALTTSVARFTYKGIEAETNLDGYLNALFVLGGGGDCLGFDGSFFFGETVRFAKKYTVRLGIHHLSGHYGDERFSDFFVYNKINEEKKVPTIKSEEGDTYEYLGVISYVRDNNIQLAASADLLDCLYVYGSVDMPLYKSWLRPFIHCPSNHITGASDGADGFTSLADSDGLDSKTYVAEIAAEKALRKGGYLALNFDIGAEYEKKFSFGNVFAAVDFQAHQDGQTKHQIGAYDKKNSWDFEFTAGAGVELKDSSLENRVVAIEAFYHYGRPAVSQYFYKNSMSSISFGIGVR